MGVHLLLKGVPAGMPRHLGDGLCHFSQIHVCINLVCRSLSLVVAFAPLIVIARHHGCPMMRIGQWCAHGNAISCLYRYYLPAVMFRSICVISSSAFRVPSTNAAMCALSKAHGSDMSSEHRSDGRTIGRLALPYDSSPRLRRIMPADGQMGP